MLRAFKCTYQALLPRGFFVFDLNTEYGLGKGWGRREFVKEDEEIVSIWKNHFDPAKKIGRLELTLFVPEGNRYLRIDEMHLERAYSLRKVAKLLKAAGFAEVHSYKHLTFQRPDSTTKRVMILAKKQP
jgi:hypothetical protein